MNMTAIDIETIPDPGLPATLMPTDEECAAPSNWKDDDKIAEKVSENREKKINQFGLSPITGKILMIGFLKFDTEPGNDIVTETIFSSVGRDYKEFLTEAAHYLDNEVIHVVTYRGKKFDLPYMMYQFALNQIPCGTRIPELCKKYSNSPSLDLYDFLGEDGSLSKHAYRFGGSPYGKGSEVALLHHQRRYDEIAKHLSSDLQETARIAKAFAPYM